MGVLLKFFIIQRFDGEEWVNYSCHYYLTPLGKVLKQYEYFRKEHPEKQFRIARGIAREEEYFS